ncbi:MAG: CofH family radical SAM protein [Phycisphaerae bacterium]
MIALSSIVNPALADIAEKVQAGVRLSGAEGLRLYESPHVHDVGLLADHVRRRLNGNVTYYNVNRHINYTNYCVLRCKFCSFFRPYEKPAERGGQAVAGDGAGAAAPGARRLSLALETDSLRGERAWGASPAYELTVEEIVALAQRAAERGATEVHIVGGLHPALPFSYYVEMCAAIRSACPQLHIKAFTAIEIIHFSRIARPRRSVREVLMALRDAGLGSLPGGGAEIFDDRVHAEAYQAKVGEQGWFDVHREAHALGMFTNATMLYGHVERPAERIAHLEKLRAHQDESLATRPAHFNCCIPLSFVPQGSALAHLPGPTGLDDLRTLAITRLMLDNVAHVKAFWIMQSVKLAQVAQDWGCDDLDGTVTYYDITKREGGPGNTHQELTVDQIRRLIRETGCEPVERDTLYRRVVRGRDGRIVAAPSAGAAAAPAG